jgi:hypothetical protein
MILDHDDDEYMGRVWMIFWCIMNTLDMVWMIFWWMMNTMGRVWMMLDGCKMSAGI